jgi:hypothetical protein
MPVLRGALALAATFSGLGLAFGAERVTVDNFVRAETDHYFKAKVDRGCFGAFCHDRGPPAIDKQIIIRMNRDTPYSMAVFDLASPVTIVKPDTGKRFQSMVVINEDHYIKLVAYEPGAYTLTKETMGTRYVQVAFRTLVDPNDPSDIAEMTKAQDAIKVIQADPGKLEVPDWDQDQLNGLRAAILTLGPYVTGSKGMFGDVNEVDPVDHFIGTAAGFAGNAEKDALYLNFTPKEDDGKTPYTVTVKDVPVDGFWSITVYNKDGFFEPPENAISVNNVTAKKNADGTTTVHFGGDPAAPNYLRIMPGWNYIVRLYRPRAEILEGKWTFPEAKPAS